MIIVNYYNWSKDRVLSGLLANLYNGRFIGHKRAYSASNLFELSQRPRSETSSFNDFVLIFLVK